MYLTNMTIGNYCFFFYRINAWLFSMTVPLVKYIIKALQILCLILNIKKCLVFNQIFHCQFPSIFIVFPKCLAHEKEFINISYYYYLPVYVCIFIYSRIITCIKYISRPCFFIIKFVIYFLVKSQTI